jgi:hypothetical protein
MKQNFTLISKYNNKSIGFSFDSKGNFLKNNDIDKVENYSVYESSGYINVHNSFSDAVINSVRLLKSGKEICITIYITVNLDNQIVSLHLCKMSVDLKSKYIFLNNHNVNCKFNFNGNLKYIDNNDLDIKLISNCISIVRDSSSIEKRLKIEYFDDIKSSNLINISFYPYIQKQYKPLLLKEIIRASYNINKVVDMKNFYPFPVVFKKIKSSDIAGYWLYTYKSIELDYRFDRDTIRSVFYHEYGHLIYDYAIVDDNLLPALKKKAKQIMHTIINILNNEETISDINQYETGDFKKYLLIPTEIFARLFASYMIYEHDIKAQFEINNFNDYEVTTVTPLLQEFLKVIQSKDDNYVHHCATCGKTDNVKFYAVVSHDESFVQYNWFCPECLKRSEENIKELYKVKIDDIKEENMEYLLMNR